MRYANPAYLKAALDKLQKEVTSVENLVSELQELKAKGLLKDPQEESYMSQLRTKWMEEEAEDYRTAQFVKPLTPSEREFIRRIEQNDEQFEIDALRVNKEYEQAEKEYFEEKVKQSKIDDLIEELIDPDTTPF